MHTKTEFDLALLKKKKEQIAVLNEEIIYIKNNCPHKDWKLTCEENFTFDMAPCKKCLVCDEHSSDLTYDEKFKAIENEIGWYEDECGPKFSHDEIDKIVKAGGYSF